MLVESDIDSRVGRPRQFAQRFKLLQTQQRRMRRVCLSRLLALPQGIDLSFGFDADRLGFGLRGQFRRRGLSFSFRAMRVSPDLRVNALSLGPRARLD